MQVSYDEISSVLKFTVNQMTDELDAKIKVCANLASQALLKQAHLILSNSPPRSGKVYKKPNVNSTYRASAPGEPPALRTGALRASFSPATVSKGKGNYTAKIYSDQKYAAYLDEGTSKMAARPYKEKIIEKAKPEIVKIFSRLTT